MHQPHYLPWLGYMEKWDRADLFIIVDHVQFKRKEWQNRNHIKASSGRVRLTVPVLQKSRDERICDKIIDDRGWRLHHRRSIDLAYSRAPFYADHSPGLDNLLGLHTERLVDLNVACMMWFAEILGIDTPAIRSTELVPTRSRKTSMIVELCQQVGGNQFLSGDGASTYLNESEFDRVGIELVWQNYRHPTYSQLYSDTVGFIPYLSALDLFMNKGRDALRTVRAGAGR
jgi:hypothetical protein